eukprot:TRINITY_DN17108_c0_g2_i2.p1 TRINITY_DN17108_c0_g2~~TRINITY_DN17108_c0_g2_i2.p1  ORF type:complete len:244 (-),score=-14.00 TRINITY_DN17108_c0_g2_i2:443-1174(-)
MWLSILNINQKLKARKQQLKQYQFKSQTIQNSIKFEKIYFITSLNITLQDFGTCFHNFQHDFKPVVNHFFQMILRQLTKHFKPKKKPLLPSLKIKRITSTNFLNLTTQILVIKILNSLLTKNSKKILLFYFLQNTTIKKKLKDQQVTFVKLLNGFPPVDTICAYNQQMVAKPAQILDTNVRKHYQNMFSQKNYFLLRFNQRNNLEHQEILTCFYNYILKFILQEISLKQCNNLNNFYLIFELP